MRILILGASGMLGHTEFRMFSSDNRYDVWGTLRGNEGRKFFPQSYQSHLISGVDILNSDSLIEVVGSVRPDAIVNCVGLIKQLPGSADPLMALPINAMFPHRLSWLAALFGARVIHMSTDCVFSGRKGDYREPDISDAEDVYGKSKYLGELRDDDHAITLRTSIIGHELGSTNALVDWFLSQKGKVRGFSRAIFSGLPAVELARVIRDFVLPRPEIHGLYHVSAEPISKLALLRLVATTYGKDVEIVPDEATVIDRSLNSERFMAATGYVAPNWPELVAFMRENRWERTEDGANV